VRRFFEDPGVRIVQPDSGAAPSSTSDERARSSLLAGIGRFAMRHPVGVAQGFLVALVAVVVLQNLEPTSIDLLFWSVPSLPKLVLILVAMLAGGALWEMTRRLLAR
jgi:uncharacterized integral membrane protein